MEQSIKHSSKSRSVNRKENKYGAHNYHPLPVVLEKEVFCMGCMVKKYYDSISLFSQSRALSSKIGAMMKQAQTLTLTSRAFL
jgi:ornithine--oxo-acid transaminase